MMLRIFLLFILGALPLCAQSGVQNGGRLNPDQVPGVEPATPSGSIIMQPGINAPPPGAPPVLPEMPAEPPVIPKIKAFTVVPGTVRDSQQSKYALLTTIELTAPATHDILCHVVSSDPLLVIATDITIIKGHGIAHGGIQVNWFNIKHDGKVEFEAYDVEHPENAFHGRLYFKKPPEPIAEPTSEP